MEHESHSSLWRLPGIRSLVCYTVSGFIGFCITIASLPAWLANEKGVASALAGLTTTVLLAVTVGLQLLVPRLVSRIGLGPALAVGLICLGGPSLLFLIDGGLAWVLAICVVRGAGFGVLTVLGAAMAARIPPADRRGEAIGIQGLAISVPYLLAVPGGVALVSVGMFHWVAIIGSFPLLGLVAVRHLARSVDLSVPAATPTSRSSRRLAARATVSPTIVLLVVTLAGGGFSTYLPIARPNGSLATLALLVWGIAAAVARWRVGRLADRSGTTVLLPAASILTVASMSVIAGGMLIGSTTGSALILIASAVFGVGYGAAQNLTLVVALNRAKHRETATVSSVWNIGFDSGTALGAAMIGAIATHLQLPFAYLISAALVAVTIPLAITSARTTGKGTAQSE